MSSPPVSSPVETEVTRSKSPEPTVDLNEEPKLLTKSEENSPWFWFLIGLVSGIFINIFGLIPLFILPELKNNKKNRNYYLFGWLLPIVISVVLVIIWIVVFVILGTTVAIASSE